MLVLVKPLLIYVKPNIYSISNTDFEMLISQCSPTKIYLQCVLLVDGSPQYSFMKATAVQFLSLKSLVSPAMISVQKMKLVNYKETLYISLSLVFIYLFRRSAHTHA